MTLDKGWGGKVAHFSRRYYARLARACWARFRACLALTARGSRAGPRIMREGIWEQVGQGEGIFFEACSCALSGEILEVIDAMGDRTFSSNDVLRIFAEYLEESEQEIVREFFREPSDIDAQILARLLQLLLEFVQIFTGPLIGLAISVLSQAVNTAYNELVVEISRTTRILDREIRRIDA